MAAAPDFSKLGFSLRRRLPVILQTEVAECGLACLAMVAGFHGNHVGLAGLRAHHAASARGLNLTHLMEIAESIGLQPRALRPRLEQIGALQTPCILHWGMNHFVVLASVRSKQAVIHDPAGGRRSVSVEELSRQFTGVALELVPRSDFVPSAPPPRVTLRELTGRVTGLYRGLAYTFAAALILQIFVLVSPFYLQWVVDHGIETGNFSLVSALAVGFLLLMLLQTLTSAVRSWAVLHLSITLGVQWQTGVVRHLLRLPLSFFERRSLGDVMSRVESTRSIQHTLGATFVEAVIDGLMAVVTLAVMLSYSAWLALVTVGATIVYLLLRMVLYRPTRAASEEELVRSARQQSHLMESVRGIQSLKLAGCEEKRQRRWHDLLIDTTNKTIQVSYLRSGFALLSQLIFGAERILVIWIAALMVLRDQFSLGMLFAYLAYKDQFAARVSGLIDKWVEFRMLRVHGERLSEVVHTPVEAVDGSGTGDLPPAADIEVRGVWFRYSEHEAWLLEDCTFKVTAGESIAITGPSGCGKTTLVKVMLGLLEPARGEVLFGGENIRSIGLSAYRGQLGVVMQEDHLFAGSIAENIAFSEPADMARVVDAATSADIHGDVSAMPMGYHTVIGELGAALSGGQKQRVLLARALYRQPKLLFLDEATSHLDVKREAVVNDAVRRLHVTRVIVAHRPETVRTAERVLELRDRRVVESAAGGRVPTQDAALRKA